MCMDVRKNCQCGKNHIQFHLRDNVLLPEVISQLYCPDCLGPEHFDSETMVNDNNWVIEYDMLMAKMLLMQKLMLPPESITPEFIFDEGYGCWQEMYPGEQEDIKKERNEIIGLLQEDQQRYLETIQTWNVQRVAQLKENGWRKAQRS